MAMKGKKRRVCACGQVEYSTPEEIANTTGTWKCSKCSSPKKAAAVDPIDAEDGIPLDDLLIMEAEL